MIYSTYKVTTKVHRLAGLKIIWFHDVTKEKVQNIMSSLGYFKTDYDIEVVWINEDEHANE
jgi:hypothetical protein